MRVRRDGLPDEMFTEHWDEVIDAYLPSGIAHLFFFDGEQIMELAEGGHAAEILGTAIHSLLGLDLVDRLESDLKVLERRKRSEGLGDEAIAELAIVRSELAQVDGDQEKAANDEGRLVNEAGRLAKEVTAAEDTFRAEGGDLYIQRNALEATLTALKAKRSAAEASLRDLVAGPLPLLLVEPQLEDVEQQVQHEREIRHAKTLVEALDERDQQVLSTLRDGGLPTASVKAIQKALAHDRNRRAGLASEPLLLDAPDGLAPHLRHLRAVVLPSAEALARKLVSELDALNEHVARVESDLERVLLQLHRCDQGAQAPSTTPLKKSSELQLLKMSEVALAKRRAELEARLDRIGENRFDQMVTVDDREDPQALRKGPRHAGDLRGQSSSDTPAIWNH